MVLPTIILLVVCGIMLNPVHEYGHAVMAKVFNYDAKVHYGFLHAHYTYSGASGYQLYLIRLAGGFAAFVVYGLLCLASYLQLKYSKWELDSCVVFGIFAAVCLADGLLEMLSINRNFAIIPGILAIILSVVVIYFSGSMKRFYKELDNND